MSEDARAITGAQARGGLHGVLRGAGLLTGASLLVGVGNLAFTVLIGRLGGVRSYGAVGALVGLTAIVGILATGIQYTIARRVATAEADGASLLRGVASLLRSPAGIVVALALLGAAFVVEPLTAYLHLNGPLPVVLVVGTMAATVLGAVPTGIALGRELLGWIALAMFTAVVVRIGTGILLVQVVEPVTAATGATLLGVLAPTIVLTLRLALCSPRPVEASRSPGTSMAAETWVSSIGAGLVWLLWTLPLLLARHKLDSAAAGDLVAVETVSSSIIYLCGAPVTAFFPRLAQRSDRALATWQHLVVLAMGAAGLACLTIVGPLLIGRLYGGEFSAGRDLFAVLGAGAMGIALVTSLFWVLRARQASGLDLVAGLGTAVVAEVLFAQSQGHEQVRVASMPLLASIVVLATLLCARPLATPLGSLRDLAHKGVRLRVQPPFAIMLTLRRLLVAIALLLIIAAAPSIESSWGEAAAQVAFLCLVTATTLLALEAWWPRSDRQSGDVSSFTAAPAGVTVPTPGDAVSSRNWRIAAVVVALAAGLMVQTWFGWTDTALAGGDNIVPGGLAWIRHMFDAWSKDNFGGPNGTAILLPWAAVLRVVTWLGGTPSLAERVWLTGLVVGAAIATLCLLRLLHLRPAPSAVGALIYVANPWLVSVVGFSGVYWTAVALCPLSACLVIATARRTMPVWASLLVLIPLAAFVGYANANPPLLLAIGGASAAAVVLLAITDGRRAALRGVGSLCLGWVIVALISLYWLVPFLVQVKSVNTHLASISSWAWTENRATIGNGLWLNTSWGWHYLYYFPYSSTYDVLPLSILRFGAPLLAFSALLMRAGPVDACANVSPPTRARLVATASAGTLLVVFLSTGTRFPGSLLFDRLYALPYGWLLREPGRFLGLAALGYAILAASSTELIVARVIPVLTQPTLARRARIAVPALAATVVALIPAYPMATGTMTSGSPLLGPSRVQLPTYWTEMARLIDRQPRRGTVLLLPPDDFLYMPFNWPYYTADGFEANLIDRPVIWTPFPGYTVAAPPAATIAVQLAGEAIRDRHWSVVRGILHAMGIRYIVVRGDVDVDLARKMRRHILDPKMLNRRLAEAADFHVVGERGPLTLYEWSDPATRSGNSAQKFVSADTSEPDLRILDALEPGTEVVSGVTLPGTPQLRQMPPLAKWERRSAGPAATLATTTWVPSGWTSRVIGLGGSGALPDSADLSLSIDDPEPTRDGRTRLLVSVRLGRDLLAERPWSPVGDCNASNPPGAALAVTAIRGPHGASGFRLSAHHDAACIAHELTWRGGAVLLDMLVRHVAGPDPRLCIWETEARRCADTEPLPAASSWQRYRTIVHPDPTAGSLVLFLYTFGDPTTSPRSANEYCDIHVTEFSARPEVVDVLAFPPSSVFAPTRWVTVLPTAFSPRWESAVPAQHVIVDGLANGWVASVPVTRVTYAPTSRILAAQVASLVTCGLVLIVTGLRLLRSYFSGT